MTSTLHVGNALKNPGQPYPFEAEVQIEELIVLNDPVQFESVCVKGTVMSADDDVINVLAVATAQVKTRCANCLEPVQFPIKAKLDVHYTRTPDPENPDLYMFDASTIELIDSVRDALLLELPMRFLCKANCKGLCSQCGANLNEGTCTCQKGGEVTNPFAALKAIVQNDEEV